MAMQLSGIVAKFEGKCPICRRGWNVGDLIEKIPNSDGKRGHAQCVAGEPADGRTYGARATHSETRNGGPPPAREAQDAVAIPAQVFSDVSRALALIADGFAQLARVFGRFAPADLSDDPEIPF